MIFFFYGVDTLRAKETIKKLKVKFRQSTDPHDHNIHYFEADTFILEDFFSTARTSGLLSTKKLLILKDPFEYKLNDVSKKAFLDFISTLKDAVDEIYIIFWQTGNPDKRAKLYKLLTKFKYVQEFKQLSTDELRTWLIQKATAGDKVLTTDNANLLITLVGTDSWHLHTELQKIISYSSHKKITSEDITISAIGNTEQNIWLLVDAIGMRQQAQALKMVHEHFQIGTPPLYLLTMIIRQFRLILKTKEAMKENTNSYALAQRLKLAPFIITKLQQQANQFTDEKLRMAYQELTDLDRILKSEPDKASAAFTMLVQNL